MDKPFLFVSADANVLDAEGKAVALIAWVALGRTALPGTQPAGR